MNEEFLIGEDGYYHYVYKTTNLVNGKMYIGVHMTNNLADGYLGSGKIFKSAVKKYGKESFSRKILLFCQTREESLVKEIFYISNFRDFYGKDKLYNITEGGQGVGFGENHPMFGRSHTAEARASISKSITGEKNPFYGKSHSKETREHLSKIGSTKTGELNSFYGRKHTDEFKRQLSESRKGGKSPSAKQIEFRGEVFGSIQEACEKHFPEYSKAQARNIVKGIINNNGVDPRMTKEQLRQLQSEIATGGNNSYAKPTYFKGKFYSCRKDIIEEHYPELQKHTAYVRIRKELAKEREFQIAGEVITADY